MAVEYPKDWVALRAGEATTIKARIGWRGLKASEYTKTGPYLIAGKHIINGRVQWDKCDHLSQHRYEESPEIQLKNGDVIISKDGTIGRVALVDKIPGPTTINGTMMLVRPRKEVLISGYLAQYLQGREFDLLVKERISGSSIPHLFQRDIAEFIIPVPPISEQKKIAEILESVDEAIAKTQAVIAQTQRVKQGLLHTLLTRGIGHTKFKQTEIGEIPESWEILRLEQLLANTRYAMRSGPFGSALRKSELVEFGIPFLGIDNIHVERFVSKYRRFVSHEKFSELRKYAVQENDVMITIMGTVGRCCVAPKGLGEALSSKHIWTMTFDQRRYIPDIICWQLNYAPWVTKSFNMTAQGGIMEAISSKIVRAVKLPVPSLTEQKKIHEVMQRFNKLLELEEDKLNVLMDVKSGLMSDLLTGRVRVKLNRKSEKAA